MVSGSSRGKPELREFEEIGERVLQELNRRLGDHLDAADLPGTLLMRLAEKYIQYLEKQMQWEQQQAEAEEEPSVLDMINQPGLDPQKKCEILYSYCGELRDKWKEATDLMFTIAEENSVDLQAMSGVS